MRVHLNGTFGYGRPCVYYGPGVCEVPDGLARALGLEALPDADPPAYETVPESAVHGTREERPDDAEPGVQIRPTDAPPARTKPVQRGKR